MSYLRISVYFSILCHAFSFKLFESETLILDVTKIRMLLFTIINEKHYRGFWSLCLHAEVHFISLLEIKQDI